MKELLFAALTASAIPDMVSGVGTAVDGDTVRIGTHMKIHVRIRGIAAPELYQTGGKQALERMETLINGKLVVCVIPLAAESHDRLVGSCAVDMEDIGDVMTREGLARDCYAYSGGKYYPTQAARALDLPLPAYCHEEKRK